MASPARGLTPREEAGVLRDFYLVLWKQLDLRSGQTKWFDIAAVSAASLRERADDLLNQLIELEVAPELLSRARQDRGQVLEAVEQPPNSEAVEEFQTYLRDRALDFAQQAAQVA